MQRDAPSWLKTNWDIRGYVIQDPFSWRSPILKGSGRAQHVCGRKDSPFWSRKKAAIHPLCIVMTHPKRLWYTSLLHGIKHNEFMKSTMILSFDHFKCNNLMILSIFFNCSFFLECLINTNCMFTKTFHKTKTLKYIQFNLSTNRYQFEILFVQKEAIRFSLLAITTLFQSWIWKKNLLSNIPTPITESTKSIWLFQ